MDLAMQTDLLRATQYFNEQMEKVYVRHCRHNRIYPFIKRAHNPSGGMCYNLSTWALMGLKPDDMLIRGQLNLPKSPGYSAEKNYKHGWVKFSFEGNNFIYDSLEGHIWPQEYWEQKFHPHGITFEKSLQEILDLIFDAEISDNLYQVDDYLYQFKCIKQMKLPYDTKNDGYLKSTLAGAQINYSGYGPVGYFLAEDRSQ